jgi:hypothetical protein
MSTAYLNNIQESLGECIRGTINKILNTKDERRSLYNHGTNPQTKQNIRDFFGCVARFKEIIRDFVFVKIMESSNILDEIEAFGPEFIQTLYMLAPVLIAAASKRDKFTNNNLWYDIKSYPARHLNTSYELSALCETLGHNTFQAFPLRTTSIPCFIPLDIGIVMSHIFELRSKEQQKWRQDPFAFWNTVFNLDGRPFLQNNRTFTGWLRTDGESIHITRSLTGQKTRYGARKRKRGLSTKEADDIIFRCLQDVPQEELCRLRGKCILIDPNRRDILYAMHESSTSDNPIIFRYTSMGRRTRTAAKKHQNLLRCADNNIVNAVNALSACNKKSVSTMKFNEYLTTRHVHRSTLDTFYSRRLFRYLRYDSHIRRQREADYLANKLSSLLPNDGERPTIIIGATNISNARYRFYASRIINVRFHAPTPGVMMRRLLHQKGFNVILI